MGATTRKVGHSLSLFVSVFVVFTTTPLLADCQTRAMLKLVLSNCKIDAENITPTYRKPFNLIFARAKNEGMARPGRFELPTLCLEGRRSIQLSYGR